MLLVQAVCTLVLTHIAASNELSKVTKTTGKTTYDPGELLAKIFNPNTTVSYRQRGYGLIFEDQKSPQAYPDEDQHGQYGLIAFEDNKNLKFEDDHNENSNVPLKFEDDGIQSGNYRPLQDQEGQVTFQDENTITQGNKKRRRRRRKPKNGLNYQGPQGYQGSSNPGVPGRPGYGLYLESGPNDGNPGFGPNPNANYGFPGPAPFKRRRRRPKPSLASDALTAVTGALTSIALYDDYQCVPRLLCEAAGGGSLGSNGVLDSIAGIQPLLTLLSAYNGISSSPLFVFGRAVFLGMTSRGHTGTCRYAYPQCPTDPEQLIHYLNNHNGGFFRFFNAPLPNQDLEQFYNHLGQNGQFYGQDLGQYGQGFGQNGQFNPGEGFNQDYLQQSPNYGLYQNQQSGQDYGFQNNHIGNQRPGLYGQNYGSNYDYNTYGSNVRFKDSNAEIEKRIQNKPLDNDDNRYFEDDDDLDTKWQFPDEANSNTFNTGQTPTYFDDSDTEANSLRFPDESHKYDDKRDSKRKGKSILFPENQYNHNAYSNKNYMNIADQNSFNRGQAVAHYNNNYRPTTARPYQYYNNVNTYKGTTTSSFNENDYYYDHKHNFYVKKTPNQQNYSNNKYQNQNNIYNKQESYDKYNEYYDNSRFTDDGTQTVYVVRGNGDPSMPEIVKVRPGQTVLK